MPPTDKPTAPPTLTEAEIEAMGYAERQRRAPEIAAAVAAGTLVPKRYGRRENDRGWTIAQLAAEEDGAPPASPPIHYEADLARLPPAERLDVYAAAERGEAEIVPSLDGRRTYLERIAASKAAHEAATAEWARLTGTAPPPRSATASVEGLPAAELAALLDG